GRLTCGRGKRRAAFDLLRGRLLSGSLRPFFFLGRRRALGYRPQFADPRGDLNELLTELLIVAKFRHLALRFGNSCGIRKGLADSLAFDLVSEPISRSMRGFVGTVTAAVRLARAA